VTLADDQAELLRALVRNGVEFVVVGGVAAQLRGWSGATTDLDIAVASEESNTARINRALEPTGIEPVTSCLQSDCEDLWKSGNPLTCRTSTGSWGSVMWTANTANLRLFRADVDRKWCRGPHQWPVTGATQNRPWIAIRTGCLTMSHFSPGCEQRQDLPSMATARQP
jgi:hypothetical protein